MYFYSGPPMQFLSGVDKRTCFERIAEHKVRRRHLTDDGNVEINGRDFPGAPDPRPQRPSLWDIRGAA
jgi:hypothetical protein